jgi:predicted AAA+ superfamily ATPase
VKVEFIQDLIAENGDHMFVQLNNLLFGSVEDRPAVDLHGNAKETNAELLALSYLAQLLVCFWTI